MDIKQYMDLKYIINNNRTSDLLISVFYILGVRGNGWIGLRAL